MQDFMKELQDVFEDVKDKDTMFENLNDGEYMANILEVIVGESKRGKPMVTMIFEVTYGADKGRQHRKFMLLSGKDERQLKSNLHRYATEIKKLGIDTSKGLESTFEQLDKIADVPVKMTITTTVNKNNGSEWTNTSFELID